MPDVQEMMAGEHHEGWGFHGWLKGVGVRNGQTPQTPKGEEVLGPSGCDSDPMAQVSQLPLRWCHLLGQVPILVSPTPVDSTTEAEGQSPSLRPPTAPSSQNEAPRPSSPLCHGQGQQCCPELTHSPWTGVWGRRENPPAKRFVVLPGIAPKAWISQELGIPQSFLPHRP